jgi:hypothetical protein
MEGPGNWSILKARAERQHTLLFALQVLQINLHWASEFSGS